MYRVVYDWRAQQDSLVAALRLRGNRNDFAVLCLQNLLVVEPGKRLFAKCIHSNMRHDKLQIGTCADFKFMARPAGLEPATHRLEICCSIQLSHGRTCFAFYIKKDTFATFYFITKNRPFGRFLTISCFLSFLHLPWLFLFQHFLYQPRHDGHQQSFAFLSLQ